MSNSRSNFVTIFESILIIFFLIIIVSNLFRFTTGRADTLTFEGLLNMLHNASFMPSLTSVPNLQIGGSWGIFDFLRIWLNSVTGLFSFGVWFVSNILNAVTFVLTFMFQLFWI